MTDKLARVQLARAAFALKAKGALPALVLMTDDRLADPVAAAHALPRGSMVILRANSDARRSMLAAKLRPLTRRQNIKLLIADDPRLASRVDADGIHLPETRAKLATYWRVRHPGWIITAAAHSLRATHVRDVDALILAPVFPTRSHPGGAHLGPAKARMVARQASAPVYALGGVTARRASALREGPFAGLAAVSALVA